MASAFRRKLPDLRKSGPLCKVTIKPSIATIDILKSEKKKVPSQEVLALIDTGASSTAISRKIAKKLKLVSRGSVKVYTSSKKAEMRNEYDVSLLFSRKIHLDILRALEANLQDHHIDCLIGRDILDLGTFTYDGPKGVFVLDFNP